jgi:predicted NBD/HSP70 family sugar kinase
MSDRGNIIAAPRPTMGAVDVRRHHLSLVLEQLLRNGPRSRARLAQETGLTKATMSALVFDLLARGLVEEREARSGRMGRPAVDVCVTGSTVGALGLQIEGDHVAACIVDLSGEVRVRHRRDGDNRDARPRTVLGRLRRVATDAMTDADEAGIRCVGGWLAIPGLVDPESGALFVAPNLHWLDVDLTDPESMLGLPESMPVTVDNEANLGALAELRHGVGREISSFVYVSGGVGVGAGIVIDGQIVRGAHGFAGELGHVMVDQSGRLCACGEIGCLETVVGGGYHTSVERQAEALATALRSVVHLLDPEAIVLGGTFAADGDDLALAVADRLHAHTLGARWRPCQVRSSTLGPDAALIGAATAALDVVVADPTTVPIRPSMQSA